MDRSTAWLHALALHTTHRVAAARSRRRTDAGQTTAEYALVLLGAAAIALLLLGWAAKTNRVGKLFDWVLDEVVGRAR